MKIGIITRWNATCGISMHAELITPEFMKMGHEVVIFAPHVHTANRWWHHKIIRENEEEFVIRCYSELEPESFAGGEFDDDVVIEEDPDYLIVESYASIPYVHIERLMQKLDCVRVAVIHEGRKRDIRYSDMRCFDAIVVFDERFLKEMLWDYREIVRIIPYPCHPVVKGNRKFAEDGLVFFSFGRQPEEEYSPYIEALDWLSKKYEFTYRIVRSDGLLNVKRPWLKQERKRLTNEEVYEFLHASDIHLLPKGYTDAVVVSSTLFQCLGSLVPTVVPNTRHFEGLSDIAVIYNSPYDLKSKLVRLIEDESYRLSIVRAAERYVEKNRCDKIARKFIQLYEELAKR